MENNTKIYLIVLGILVIGIFAFFSFQNNDSMESFVADLSSGQEEKDVNNEELVTEDSGDQGAIETEIDYSIDNDSDEKETTMTEFIQCLVNNGVVVYASKTCPACSSLAEMFGGYNNVGNLFVICGEERERCMSEMLTNYVPEIQLNGEEYQGQRSLEGLAKATNCDL